MKIARVYLKIWVKDFQFMNRLFKISIVENGFIVHGTGRQTADNGQLKSKKPEKVARKCCRAEGRRFCQLYW